MKFKNVSTKTAKKGGVLPNNKDISLMATTRLTGSQAKKQPKKKGK